MILGGRWLALAGVAAAVAAAVWFSAPERAVAQAGRPEVTKETVEAWMQELSNWGRWGRDDEKGAVNLITPEKRKRAAALVREGFPVSLSRDAEKEQAADNPAPFSHTMRRVGGPEGTQSSSDTYAVSYHGYAHTHLDSLCHFFFNGRMYNGFSRDEIGEKGAARLSVRAFKDGIFTRGVLMDIPRLKGVRYLEPGTPIYPEDLEAWEKQSGVRVEAGDVVLIRTGRWTLRDEKGAWDAAAKSAGLHASCARWLKARDAAIIGSDAASDVMPSGVEGVRQPIHQLAIIAMGMPILDNCDLEALAEEAGKRKRWAFLLTAAPLAVAGGTGSPLNPIATF